MKRFIESSTTIEAMSKLKYKFADKTLFDVNFGEFIYFSPVLDSHGPRIKFYGGSKETSTTRTAPSLTFGVDVPCTVLVQSWMNNKNCPNAFDEDYIRDLVKTVQKIKPLLLLVWFNRLDEAETLKYFEGDYSWNDLLESVQDVDDSIMNEILKCKNLKELDACCKKYNLYTF